jgi:acyl-CoA thioesterase-1
MLMKGKGRIILLALVLMTALYQCKKTNEDGDGSGNLSDMTVVFVGASITENWNFDHYFAGYNFQKVIHYDWDKTQVWDQVEALHPNIVLVKICGAYFYTEGGTPLNEFESSVQTMVSNIRNLGAIPVLATTLPVDVGYGDCTQAQLNDLRAFNDWVRSYCSSQSIVLMDYYQRIADAQGQLPTACHDGDGLHPNDAGYDILSPLVIPTLESAL